MESSFNDDNLDEGIEGRVNDEIEDFDLVGLIGGDDGWSWSLSDSLSIVDREETRGLGWLSLSSLSSMWFSSFSSSKLIWIEVVDCSLVDFDRLVVGMKERDLDLIWFLFSKMKISKIFQERFGIFCFFVVFKISLFSGFEIGLSSNLSKKTYEWSSIIRSNSGIISNLISKKVKLSILDYFNNNLSN